MPGFFRFTGVAAVVATAVVAVPVGLAGAGAVVEWEATASVGAFASSEFFGTTDSCTDAQTYTGTGLISDLLQCSAQAGYGSAATSLSLETQVTEHAVFTEVAASGGGQGYVNDGGSFSDDFDQVARIDAPTSMSIHLVGALTATELSTSAVRVQNADGVLAEYLALAEFEPVSFDEVLTLDPGQHEVVVSLRCRPRSAGPHGLVDGAVSASLFASVSSVIAVERGSWGSIKALYR